MIAKLSGLNMCDVWWRPGLSRRCQVIDPLLPDHAGYAAECMLCPRLLGGQGTQALPLQPIVVGPAEGDERAKLRNSARAHYSAAAIVVHQECADRLSDQELEKFVGGLRMIRTVASAPIPSTEKEAS